MSPVQQSIDQHDWIDEIDQLLFGLIRRWDVRPGCTIESPYIEKCVHLMTC